MGHQLRNSVVACKPRLMAGDSDMELDSLVRMEMMDSERAEARWQQLAVKGTITITMIGSKKWRPRDL